MAAARHPVGGAEGAANSLISGFYTCHTARFQQQRRCRDAGVSFFIQRGEARRRHGCATADLFFTTDETVGGGGEEVTDFHKESRLCLREEVRFGRACSHAKSTAGRKEVRPCLRFHSKGPPDMKVGGFRGGNRESVTSFGDRLS